jgi:glyoxylase-like metal-dependent hydrolase (beta-lactamase superfamily II)
MENAMLLLSHTGGIANTNCYLVGDDATRQAVIFDAPDHTVAPLLDAAEARGFDVIGLWLTHGHFDHIADHAAVTARFPAAKVLIHPLDEPKLINPASSSFILPFTIPPRRADARVEDGQKLSIGSLEVEVMHTPGHAPGHVMYHFPREKLLIGGDLILMHSVGRTDLPDSDAQQLAESLRRVMRLPGETRLLSGHGSESTLEQESRINPFVIDALGSNRG